MTALHDRQAILGELLRGTAVGATLLLLGESTTMAAATAVGFLALRGVGYAVQQVVGEYADHVLLGSGILVGTAYLGRTGIALPWLAGGGIVGGWLLVDGIQGLRHGRSREDSVAPLVADGNGPVRGFVRAMIGRLLLPFRLGDTDATQ